MERKKSTRNRPLDIERCVAKNMTFASSLKSKNIKVFVSIIKAMNFVDNTEIELTDNGLKYIAEESKCFQVKAYIMNSFFDKFLFKPSSDVDGISFGVNLTSITDLLTAFIDNDLGNMNITYFDSENLIVFTCIQIDSEEGTRRSYDDGSSSEDDEPSEIRTEYFLKTMHSIEPLDFSSAGKITSDLILDAAFLLNMLYDFDRNIEEIVFKITTRKFQVKSRGVHQSGAFAKVNPSHEAFDKFLCNLPTAFAYKFSYFKTMVKALNLASKVSIRTLDDGLLRIQLKVRTDEEESSAFIEYHMMPNIDEESDEES